MKRHLLPYYIFIRAHVAEVTDSKKKTAERAPASRLMELASLRDTPRASCDGSAVSMCACRLINKINQLERFAPISGVRRPRR